MCCVVCKNAYNNMKVVAASSSSRAKIEKKEAEKMKVVLL